MQRLVRALQSASGVPQRGRLRAKTVRTCELVPRRLEARAVMTFEKHGTGTRYHARTEAAEED